MSLLREALPEFIGALGAAIALSGAAYFARRTHGRRSLRHAAGPPTPHVRRYTLLGTVTADGSPLQFSSTRPAGSTVTRVRDGRVDRFQLTDVPLHDGTFAAEPTHWYL